jgi:hypothetical protein
MILHSNFIEHRNNLEKIKKKAIFLDKINKQIIQLSENSKKTKNIILFNNFVGIASLSEAGLEIESNKKLEFIDLNYLNRYKQIAFDSQTVLQKLDTADIVVILETPKLTPQWVPLNSQTEQIANYLEKSSALNSFKLHYQENFEGDYIKIYKKRDLNLNVVLNNPTIDNWMEQNTLIELPSDLNFNTDYDLSLNISIPQDIFKMNKIDSIRLTIKDDFDNLIESITIFSQPAKQLLPIPIEFTLDQLPKNTNHIYLETNIWIDYPNDPRKLTFMFNNASLINQK